MLSAYRRAEVPDGITTSHLQRRRVSYAGCMRAVQRPLVISATPILRPQSLPALPNRALYAAENRSTSISITHCLIKTCSGDRRLPQRSTRQSATAGERGTYQKVLQRQATHQSCSLL